MSAEVRRRWTEVFDFLNCHNPEHEQLSLEHKVTKVALAKRRVELESELARVTAGEEKEIKHDSTVVSPREDVSLQISLNKSVDIEPIVGDDVANHMFFKVVAVVGHRFFSVYDGFTEYSIGTILRKPAVSENQTEEKTISLTKMVPGFFVFATLEAAMRAKFPHHSKLIHAPRALLAVRVGGAYCRNSNSIFSFEEILPTALICRFVSNSRK